MASAVENIFIGLPSEIPKYSIAKSPANLKPLQMPVLPKMAVNQTVQSQTRRRSDTIPPMTSTIPFACRCGAVTGQLTHVDPHDGTHAVCHCKSCRRAMEIAGLEEDAVGGVDIYQTAADRVEVEYGAEHLVPMQFSPDKGIYRWHAACCDTPMFNTMKTPAFFFAGVLTRNLADITPLGPVVMEGYVPDANGKQRHKNLKTLVWRLFKRAARARLSGRYRNHPFFAADRKPVAEPQLLGESA